ncbi:hypothetical protein CTZ27_03035 [Streptomyces griseocarneus]|nr:hypothetical protein CTZ27_03035 [Streptomyces griseocarneus]
MTRPGYRITIEISGHVQEQVPELDAQAIAGLDAQEVVPVVEFEPRRRLGFRSLARDLGRHRGQVVYIYPGRGGRRWVELRDAQDIAAVATTADELAKDAQDRKTAARAAH